MDDWSSHTHSDCHSNHALDSGTCLCTEDEITVVTLLSSTDEEREWFDDDSVVSTLASLLSRHPDLRAAFATFSEHLPTRQTLYAPSGAPSVFIYDPSCSNRRDADNYIMFKSGAAKILPSPQASVRTSRLCLTQRSGNSHEGRLWLFEQAAQKIGLALVHPKHVTKRTLVPTNTRLELLLPAVMDAGVVVGALEALGNDISCELLDTSSTMSGSHTCLHVNLQAGLTTVPVPSSVEGVPLYVRVYSM